jgi:hypothetical protein
VAVGDSNLAGVARVAFEAQTGEFNRDVSRAEATYKSATEGMSDASIRLELANERLRRSLAKGPSASREQARSLLQVRQAERDLTEETNRNTRAQERNQRELRQSVRGAVAGSGAFRGLGRSIAFASGTFLGTAGLVYGIRSALSAASNMNEQTSKSRVVFGQASAEVERFAKNALGLAKDQALETAGSIGALLRPMGIVEERSAKISIGLTRLGTDLSSFYNTSVQDALDAIRSGLVGEVEPLRRYGVIVSATKVQQEAMAATGKKNAAALTDEEKALARVAIILRETSLAHGDYARTIGGSANQERELQKNWRNTQILLGQTLQPTYNDLLHTVNEWLGQAKNQERIQRDVNRAVQAGVGTFNAIKGAIETAADVVEPLVKGLGGVENTLKGLAGVWLVFKARGVLGFSTTAASSRAASVRMVADATAAGRAWDYATRPRVMSVTTVGGGAGPGPVVPVPTGGGGRTPTPAPAPRRGGRLGGLLGTVAWVAAALVGPELVDKIRRQSRGETLTAQEAANSDLTDAEIRRAAKAGLVAQPELAIRLRRQAERNRRPGLGGDFDRPGMGRPVPQPPPRPGTTTPSGGAGAGGGTPRRTIADIQLDIDRSRTTPGTSDDERLVRELRDRLQRQARGLEGRRDLTKSQRATLSRLYGEIASAQGELDGYEQDREQALEKQKQEAIDKRKARAKAARERQERADRIIADFTKRTNDESARRNAALLAGLRKAAGLDKTGRPIKTDKKAKEEPSLTRGELGGILRDFLVDFVALDELRSDVSGGAGGHILTSMTQAGNAQRAEQTRYLRQIASGRDRLYHDEAAMA